MPPFPLAKHANTPMPEQCPSSICARVGRWSRESSRTASRNAATIVNMAPASTRRRMFVSRELCESWLLCLRKSRDNMFLWPLSDRCAMSSPADAANRPPTVGLSPAAAQRPQRGPKRCRAQRTTRSPAAQADQPGPASQNPVNMTSRHDVLTRRATKKSGCATSIREREVGTPPRHGRARRPHVLPILRHDPCLGYMSEDGAPRCLCPALC